MHMLLWQKKVSSWHGAVRHTEKVYCCGYSNIANIVKSAAVKLKSKLAKNRPTFSEGGEEDAEAAFAAALIGPHADDAYWREQHDVIGHRAAELILQVRHWAAAIIHRHKVALALIRVLHLILQKAQVDLQGINSTYNPQSSYFYSYFHLPTAFFLAFFFCTHFCTFLPDM